MTVGEHGTLFFVNRDKQTWSTLLMRVKKTGGDRVQLHATAPSLPYPAVWDCRKLLGLHEVYFEAASTGQVVKGRPSGAAGANLSLSGVREARLPGELR